MSSPVTYPDGLRVELDRDVKRGHHGTSIIGGDPPRVLRLSAAGNAAFGKLVAARRVGNGAPTRLVRLLVDAGVLHPRPEPALAQGQVSVVIPTCGRAGLLPGSLAAGAAAARIIVVDDGAQDPESTARACSQAGAHLIRLETPGGPAAARMAALDAGIDTPIVAFLDDDCTAHDDWLSLLAGHFADPAVAAVAPRVIGVPSRSSRLARAIAAVCPLDLGSRPGRVRPGGRVAYVPSAALLVRTEVLRQIGFDAFLRFGEDVDLVWRLHDAGHVVRYDPSVHVFHTEPARLGSMLTRRFAYGRSAGALGRRHGPRVAPLRLSFGKAFWVAATLGGCDRLALPACLVDTCYTLVRLVRLGMPVPVAAAFVARHLLTIAMAVSRMTVWLAGPLVIVNGSRRLRLVMVLEPLTHLMRRRASATPWLTTLVRFVAELAYGLGVWAGCIQHRTLAPVRPRISVLHLPTHNRLAKLQLRTWASVRSKRPKER